MVFRINKCKPKKNVRHAEIVQHGIGSYYVISGIKYALLVGLCCLNG